MQHLGGLRCAGEAALAAQPDLADAGEPHLAVPPRCLDEFPAIAIGLVSPARESLQRLEARVSRRLAGLDAPEEGIESQGHALRCHLEGLGVEAAQRIDTTPPGGQFLAHGGETEAGLARLMPALVLFEQRIVYAAMQPKPGSERLELAGIRVHPVCDLALQTHAQMLRQATHFTSAAIAARSRRFTTTQTGRLRLQATTRLASYGWSTAAGGW